MSYRIVTDTSCDFPQEMYAQLGLTAVPLSVNYKNETHTHYTESWLKELYAGLRAGEPATTSAANPQDWESIIRPILEAGEDVLVLAFSSGLSTTYQSAVIAAGELAEAFPQRKINVVDTRSASLGQGLLVYYACKQKEKGLSLEELRDWCEENKFHLCHWFTVDDLMYLKRGGRISAATALLGTMMQIKPVLHMDDEGHLISVGKARGRKASIDALVKKMQELALPGENDTVFICHGDCMEDAKYLEAQVKEKCGVKDVLIYYTGAVIGSHSGPGTLALFFLGQHR